MRHGTETVRAHRPSRDQENGFTMVELLVVMAISLTGLAGLMSVYTSVAGANVGVGQSAEAIDICEQTLEGFRSMSISELESLPEYGAITSAGWGPIAHHQGDVVGRQDVIFSVDVSAAEMVAASGLVRIRVDVSWSDDGAHPDDAVAASVHRVSLEMIRTRVEAL